MNRSIYSAPTPPAYPHSSALRGFTLMEVLMVLGIMGIIMAMVMPRVLGRQQHASIDATRVSIEGLTQALRLYSLDHRGRYPGSSENLSVLIENPGRRDTRWRGPYLDRMPQDAWGKDFLFVSPGVKNPDSFDIISPGPDGVLGNADDIHNWDLNQAQH
jgi:general secretion pathway protein G